MHLSSQQLCVIIPMEIFNSHKANLFLCLVTLLCSILCGVVAQTPQGTIERTKTPETLSGFPPSDENVPSLSPPPLAAPTFNVPSLSPPLLAAPTFNQNPPFMKPLGNQGQQSQQGFPVNNPQQNPNQPFSGLTQPFSSTNQPFSGFNLPFSSSNQPFGTSNQQGLVGNGDLDNGVLKQKPFALGVILVSLISLMASLQCLY